MRDEEFFKVDTRRYGVHHHRFVTTNACIYFIRCGDFIKIGTTKELRKRIAQLYVATPYDLEMVCLIAGTIYHERYLHKKFEHLRYRGEWFRFTDEIREYIHENFLSTDLDLSKVDSFRVKHRKYLIEKTEEKGS